jgi:hypothetical protein
LNTELVILIGGANPLLKTGFGLYRDSVSGSLNENSKWVGGWGNEAPEVSDDEELATDDE